MRFLLRHYGLDPSDVLANFLDPGRIIQLIGGILKAEIEKLFLSGNQFRLQAAPELLSFQFF